MNSYWSTKLLKLNEKRDLLKLIGCKKFNKKVTRPYKFSMYGKFIKFLFDKNPTELVEIFNSFQVKKRTVVEVFSFVDNGNYNQFVNENEEIDIGYQSSINDVRKIIIMILSFKKKFKSYNIIDKQFHTTHNFVSHTKTDIKNLNDCFVRMVNTFAKSNSCVKPCDMKYIEKIDYILKTDQTLESNDNEKIQVFIQAFNHMNISSVVYSLIVHYVIEHFNNINTFNYLVKYKIINGNRGFNDYGIQVLSSAHLCWKIKDYL